MMGGTGAALAQAMCERHYGVGADGLMLVMPSTKADVRMRLFNADGSEAEVSGNGVRCLVKYVIERGLARPRDGRLRVEAASGVLEAEVFGEGGRVERVRLSMGAPRFAPREVPVLTEAEPPLIDMPLEVDGETLAVTCLSMGNPHAVLFVDSPVAEYPLDDHRPEGGAPPGVPGARELRRGAGCWAASGWSCGCGSGGWGRRWPAAAAAARRWWRRG